MRASSDIRIIVHKTSGSLLLCYVSHHDDAYFWAERRKLETHPTTGAAQIDSDWEAEFCRVAESHPQVVAYTKNHNLGFEVPYRYGSETRTYLPDFILLVDDGHGPDDLLQLIVEIKGYRREDAKEKRATMDVYWIPGVNNLKTHGRWAFAEFGDIYTLEPDLTAKVRSEFDKILGGYPKEDAA